MIKSMTGFGRGVIERDGLKVTIEVKTLNHRYLDFHIRLPGKLNYLEEDIKKAIKQQLLRGRIDVFVTLEILEGSATQLTANFAVIDQYYQLLQSLQNKYQLASDIRASQLISFPDAVTMQETALNEDLLLDLVKRALGEALEHVVAMRRAEGEALSEDISKQLTALRATTEQISARAPQIVEAYHSKMRKRMAELLADAELDDNRLLLEAAVFADKTNIAEELVRLKAHFKQIESFLSDGAAVGRKLDFLLQEVNREVNTIGSKSPDIDISTDVVTLKSHLEMIREQVQNIE